MKPFLVNPFERAGNWYKANLHTHTTTSDGELPVIERIRQYREKGYAVLAITDHDRTNDVGGLSSEKFLVLGGVETHPPTQDGINSHHLVCLNVPYGLEIPEDSDANTRINLVKKSGGEVIYGHPYWSGHTINDLLSLNGYIALEVYNATCTNIGKGISSVHWDDLLDSGNFLPAVACDDTHQGRDIFMGWTMIKARNLDAASVMEALRAGSFYSSCGPEIFDCRFENGKVCLRCSLAAEVHFVCQKSNGRSLYADGGSEITEAEFPLYLYKGLKYIRVEIVDGRGNRAWTNPFII